MNRRQFLESVAVVGAVASVGRSVLGRGLHDDATGDSRLPDGTPYAAWEQPLTFSKTYYVDNGDPRAETDYTALTSMGWKHLVTARLIVRRVKCLNP